MGATLITVLQYIKAMKQQGHKVHRTQVYRDIVSGKIKGRVIYGRQMILANKIKPQPTQETNNNL